MGEVDPRAGTGIYAEAKLGLTIALGVVDAQAPPEICLRLDKIALAKAGQAEIAAGNRHFICPRSAFRFAPEGFSSLPRQSQLAAQQAADPHSVISGESLIGTIDPGSEFLGTREGGLRFLDAETSGPRHRMAVTGL